MLTLTTSYFLIYAVLLQLIPVKSIELVIYHTSNIHGYFDETYSSIDEKPVGGFARIAYVLNKAKENYRKGKGPPVLYFDCGDVYTGSAWFTIHKDKIATAFMNAIKPDAVCLGNAEFSYGLDGLMPYISNVTFPVVVSNLGFTREPKLEKLIKRKHIIKIEKTIIGILGYMRNRRDSFGNLAPTVDILEEVEIINSLSESLRKVDGVHIVIVLSHGSSASDMMLSRLVRYVDIIIGGDSQIFLWNGVPPDNEKPTGVYPTLVQRSDGAKLAIAYVRGRTKYLGKLHVSFDERRFRGQYSGQPILLDESIGQDTFFLELLETFRPAITEANETFLGKCRVVLNASSCKYDECNFGNLITDSFVRFNAKRYLSKYEQVSNDMWSDAAIAIINSGAIRENIIPGKRKNNVYKLDILEALPVDDLLYLIKISGADLMLALEHGAKGNEYKLRNEFLHVSGLKIVYDFAKPEGERIKSVFVKCAYCRNPKYEPIHNSSFYGIVTTEYLVNNGDGHLSLSSGKSNFLFTTNMSNIIECVMEYFDTFQVLAPEIEERIIIENPFSVASQLNFLDLFLILIFLIL
ncbi:protein 5NUC-like [Onthophagus taurus]|uniref:protein 5NUC-like n=1 Tax=Onthophagus taurus TaxID=166361 RepID=UPI0039BE0200